MLSTSRDRISKWSRDSRVHFNTRGFPNAHLSRFTRHTFHFPHGVRVIIFQCDFLTQFSRGLFTQLIFFSHANVSCVEHGLFCPTCDFLHESFYFSTLMYLHVVSFFRCDFSNRIHYSTITIIHVKPMK